jgi:hypothetical protein
MRGGRSGNDEQGAVTAAGQRADRLIAAHAAAPAARCRPDDEQIKPARVLHQRCDPICVAQDPYLGLIGSRQLAGPGGGRPAGRPTVVNDADPVQALGRERVAAGRDRHRARQALELLKRPSQQQDPTERGAVRGAEHEQVRTALDGRPLQSPDGGRVVSGDGFGGWRDPGVATQQAIGPTSGPG